MTPELEYYKSPGILTNLTSFKSFTDWLSPDPRVIFQVTQGLIIHDSWIKRYGVRMTPNQQRNKCTINASDILTQVAKLREKDISPAIPRSPEEKIQACCHEFALLAVALFKAKGIPARARCGFALYLAYPDYYEDHWICEYWNGNSWIAIDPQIDPFQQSFLQNYANTEENINPDYKKMLLSLDPLNITDKHFINAGDAWKLYRHNKVNPNRFGIGSDPKLYNIKTLYGAWFIRGQLLRDFAALNKIEPVPFLVRLEVGQNWDEWRLVSSKDDDLSDDDLKLLDNIADLCSSPNSRLTEINDLFQSNKDLYPLI